MTFDPGIEPDLKKYYRKTIKKRRETMGKLDTTEREEMSKKDFALPKDKNAENPAGEGAYPIPDESHARDALAWVSQDGTPEEQAEVARKVHEKFPNIDKEKKGTMQEWLKRERRQRAK